MGTFADSVRRNVDRVLSEIDQKCYAIAYDLFMEVVNKSPAQPYANYSKGQLINNWFAKANSFSSETTSAKSDIGINSRNSIASLRNSKTFYGKDAYITLTNNLSYAYRVEYLGFPRGQGTNGWNWTGTVGPYSMVRNSLTQVATKYK